MLDRAYSRMVNDHTHGIVALPMPTGHRIRLMTVSGDADTYGTEVASGGGYVSGSGAPLVTYIASTDATPTEIVTDDAITISVWPRDETVVGMEIWALIASTPTRLEYGDFDTPLVMTTGDNLILDSAAIAAALE